MRTEELVDAVDDSGHVVGEARRKLIISVSVRRPAALLLAPLPAHHENPSNIA